MLWNANGQLRIRKRDYDTLLTRIAAAALCGLSSWGAIAQVVSGPPAGVPGGAGITRLFSTGAVSGNGADLTEDALSTCSYTMPAGLLANVGDTVHVRAAGALGATTDSKTVRLRVGGIAGAVIATATGAAAANNFWNIDAYLVKTGPSAQSNGASGVTAGNATNARGQVQTITDTASQQILVTGQNSTSSVASSITCQVMTVNFEH